jgi:SAM-dependent methyltransferase
MNAMAVRVEPDDLLSLADFVELWWATEVAAGRDQGPVAGAQIVANKQAALRMLRRTHSGFPESAKAAGRTRLFRLGDLAEWTAAAYEQSGTVEEMVEQRAATAGARWHLARALDACAAEIGATECRRVAVATVTVLDYLGVGSQPGPLPARAKALVGETSDAVTALRAAAVRLGRQHRDLERALARLLAGFSEGTGAAGRVVTSAAAALVAGETPSILVDHVLQALDASSEAGGTARTADALAKLLVAAGQPRPGEHVVDLAAGEGNLLIEAAERAGGPLTLSGIELDPDALAIAACRLHLRGLAADLRLGDSLGSDDLPMADLVLVDPPLDGRRGYRRWLDAAVGCCGPAGRAVVALPGLTAATYRREWRDTGEAHASFLVRCPSRLRADHGDTLVLWGLTTAPSDSVLLVDASHTGIRREALTTVDASSGAKLGAVVDVWRRRGQVRAEAPLLADSVPRRQLSSAGGDMFAAAPAGDGPDPATRTSMTDALALAERLDDLVNGALRPYTAEHHRRAIKGLVQRLRNQLGQTDEREPDTRSTAARSGPLTPPGGAGRRKPRQPRRPG